VRAIPQEYRYFMLRGIEGRQGARGKGLCELRNISIHQFQAWRRRRRMLIRTRIEMQTKTKTKDEKKVFNDTRPKQDQETFSCFLPEST
jgi:hypothetical protein